jgi:hypothetical protein
MIAPRATTKRGSIMLATLIVAASLGQAPDIETTWAPRIFAAMKAANVPQRWEYYCLSLEIERQRAIVRLGEGVERLQNEIQSVRRSDQRGPVKAARIKELSARIKEWSARQKNLRAFAETPDVRLAPELGSVGKFPEHNAVDGFFVVLQVVGDDKARVRLVTATVPAEIMLTGVDTSTMIDGKPNQSSETFEAFGTERYTTVVGAPRQIVAVKPLSKADLDAARKFHTATVAKLKAQPGERGKRP